MSSLLSAACSLENDLACKWQMVWHAKTIEEIDRKCHINYLLHAYSVAKMIWHAKRFKEIIRRCHI